MSCDCKKPTLQGKQYCQECLPDEFEWLVPVDSQPDPFFMDRTHAYMTPDNTIWVLDHARRKAIALSGGGTVDLSDYALKDELKNYMAGSGIVIAPDGTISTTHNLSDLNEALRELRDKEEAQDTRLDNLTNELNNLKNVEPFDPTHLEDRLRELENKEDKDTDTTYTAGRGIRISDNNVISTDYNAKALEGRVAILENTPHVDNDTTYQAGKGITIVGNDNVINAEVDFVDVDRMINKAIDPTLPVRIENLEARTDKFVNNVTSEREGNTVKIKYTMTDGTNHTVAFEDKDTVSLEYDDTNIRNRLNQLENKPNPTFGADSVFNITPRPDGGFDLALNDKAKEFFFKDRVYETQWVRDTEKSGTVTLNKSYFILDKEAGFFGKGLIKETSKGVVPQGLGINDTYYISITLPRISVLTDIKGSKSITNSSSPRYSMTTPALVNGLRLTQSHSNSNYIVTLMADNITIDKVNYDLLSFYIDVFDKDSNEDITQEPPIRVPITAEMLFDGEVAKGTFMSGNTFSISFSGDMTKETQVYRKNEVVRRYDLQLD